MLFRLATTTAAALLLLLLTARAAYVDPMKHDIFVVTPTNFDQLISKHRNQDGVALVLHYSSGESSQRHLIDGTYNEIAAELKGIVRVGAIDCEEHEKFCRSNENAALQTPRLLLYPPSPLPPSALASLDDKRAVVNAAARQVSTRHVVTLRTAEDERRFFDLTEVAVPKVLLFSEKAKVPVLFRALANHFQDRLSFALVPPESEIALRAKVPRPYPKAALVRVTAKGGALRAPEVFQGRMNSFDELHDWLNPHAETFVKGGGFSAAAPAEKPWLTERVPEMTGSSHRDLCFGGNELCCVLLTAGPITPEQLALLEAAADRWNSLTRRWSWLDVERETNIGAVFGAADGKLPTLVVINPKKNLRFVKLPEDLPADAAAIDALMERVLAGVTYTRIPNNKLPSFAPRPQNKEEL